MEEDCGCGRSVRVKQGRWWKGKGFQFPPQETSPACSLPKGKPCLSGYRYFWVSSSTLYGESRKLCLTVDKNLKATTIYSTPVHKKTPKASKEFQILQAIDKPHLWVRLSLSKYLEEMSWNGGHYDVAMQFPEGRCGTGPDWGQEVAKLPPFALELSKRESLSSTLSLQWKLTCTCEASEWERKDALQCWTFVATDFWKESLEFYRGWVGYKIPPKGKWNHKHWRDNRVLK